MILRSSLLIVASAALLACQPASDQSKPEDMAAATAPKVQAVASPAQRLAAAIAAIPGRSEADAARDAGRKPAEVLAFLGVEPAMTVLDAVAAGGWYSEVLSAAVGPKGKVLVQNPPMLLKMREAAAEKELVTRFADDRLGNVERVDADLTDMAVAPGSVDVAITALNLHDVYYMQSAEAALGMLELIATTLKPGGVLGIVDHTGAPDGDNKSLHRIDPQLVKDLVEQSSLVLEAESGLLHNHNDDLSGMVFSPEIRGKTHRFVYRLRKPKA